MSTWHESRPPIVNRDPGDENDYDDEPPWDSFDEALADLQANAETPEEHDHYEAQIIELRARREARRGC